MAVNVVFILIDALLPRIQQGILAATLLRPEKAWYVSELARRLGAPSSSLQRELHGLEQAGVLKLHRQGQMAYHQANTESPMFPELRGLMVKTAGLVDMLAGRCCCSACSRTAGRVRLWFPCRRA